LLGFEHKSLQPAARIGMELFAPHETLHRIRSGRTTNSGRGGRLIWVHQVPAQPPGAEAARTAGTPPGAGFTCCVAVPARNTLVTCWLPTFDLSISDEIRACALGVCKFTNWSKTAKTAFTVWSKSSISFSASPILESSRSGGPWNQERRAPPRNHPRWNKGCSVSSVVLAR
jgi:hypothetical protein